MKTTHVRVLVLGVLSACQLRPDLLEVGDEDTASESDSTDTGESTDTDESTDTGGPEPDPGPAECVLQGSNQFGDPEPYPDFELPDCEVDCAEGWGHDVPWLETEWTQWPRGEFDGMTRGALSITPIDWAALVISGPGQPSGVSHFADEGNVVDGTFSPNPIDGEVLDFGIDTDKIYYFLWTDGAVQRLVALEENDNDEIIFELELGPHGIHSTLDVLDEGVIVALDNGISRLLRIDQTGNIVFEHMIPTTTEIDVSPSGGVIALANSTTLSWADIDGNFLGSQPLDDVSSLLGLVAVDDTHVVVAGGEPSLAGTRAFLRESTEMGPGWSHSYDRADAWCVEDGAHPTEELFTDVDRLADGTLVVIGVESLGHPYGNDIDLWSQPWIAHVSAAGEVLAVDRGLWLGRALDVVARDDFAYVLLTEDGGLDSLGTPYLRKYAF